MRFLGLAILVITPAGLTAQGEGVAASGWTWQLDTPARHVTKLDSVRTGTFAFVPMAPGWHITLGPGALLYDPRQVTQGRFVIESRMALFPGPNAAEYGLFIGGQRLADSTATWVAFVARADGSAAVLRRENGRTETLVPWARHAGVKPHPGGNSTAVNVFRVALDTVVTFRVNDSVIATLPRASVATNGTLGFRIGAEMNLHVTTLDVTHRLAPAR